MEDKMVMQMPVGTQTPLSRMSLSTTGRISTRDLIYQAVRDAIVRGRIPPGDSISEETLAQELQVSRTPLREALQHLQADGLVRRARNGRLHVTEVSIEGVKHLFAVRIVLEELAVTEATDRMTPSDLAALQACVDRMHAASTAHDANVAEGGHDFHELIHHIADNPVNSALLQQLQAQIDRYRFISTTAGEGRPEQAVAEHEAIYAALAKGDVEAARQAMREHLLHAKESVLRNLRIRNDNQQGEIYRTAQDVR